MMLTLIVTAVMTSVTLIISQSERLCRMSSIAMAFCGSFSAAMADGAAARSRHNSGQSLRDRIRSARRSHRPRSDWYVPPPSYCTHQEEQNAGAGENQEMDQMNPPPPAGEEGATGCSGGSITSQPQGCPGGTGRSGSVGSNQVTREASNSLHNIGMVGAHKHID